MPTHLEHAILSTLGCHTPTLYKVRVAFSKPVHAARARIGPPSRIYGTLAAKPSSYHVRVTLQATPPTSPCPTLSTQHFHMQHTETIISAQCAV